MTTTDIVLLVIGALVAVSVLVRMMLARRDQLVAEVKQQVGEAKKKQRKAAKAPGEAA